jgi:hypothetical protein
VDGRGGDQQQALFRSEPVAPEEAAQPPPGGGRHRAARADHAPAGAAQNDLGAHAPIVRALHRDPANRVFPVNPSQRFGSYLQL